MNLIRDSADAKVDIFVVFITPRFYARLPVRYLVGSLYLPQMMRSRTKSFRYAGVCLVYCPGVVVTVGGGVLTRGRLRLTSGTSGLCVIVVASLGCPYGALPAGGFALPDT